jgi:drug/metabolite transporter (DMT)-like permease
MGTSSTGQTGFVLVLLAALAFGASTPLVQQLGRSVGPFVVAALLYAGASLVAAFTLAGAGREARLQRRHLPLLFGMALAGAVVAPAALAWGLGRTSGVSAGLGLNFEAVFTALLGYALLREQIGRRALAALLLMTTAGAVLVLGRANEGSTELLGMLAILGATAGWGLDNALSSRLSHLDPGQVVFAKAALGAFISGLLARITGQPLPSATVMLGLLVVGATGYGLSLRLYLMAQRRIGAARTASVFGTAPFVAAVLAAGLGEQLGGVPTLVASALMLVGLVLHLTEKHEHRHHHDRVVHEHAHRHDDGHHMHEHDPPFSGEHSHEHTHEPLDHEHPHMPDVHHSHRHE